MKMIIFDCRENLRSNFMVCPFSGEVTGSHLTVLEAYYQAAVSSAEIRLSSSLEKTSQVSAKLQ